MTSKHKALKHRMIKAVKNVENLRKHKTHEIMARVDNAGDNNIKR